MQQLNSVLPQEDTFESRYLERMVSHTTASYKLYWLQGILQEVIQGHRVIPLSSITARMVSSAWFPVIYYHLSFGHSDSLGDLITYLNHDLHVDRETREADVQKYILSSEDQNLKKQMNDLLRYVPTRLIRPFYEDQFKEYKNIHPEFKEGMTGDLILNWNASSEIDALYVLDPKQGILTVNESWYDYLRINQAVIMGWLNYKIVQYVQKHNPSVPAVSSKIFAPEPKDRNLGKALKYWNLVSEKTDIQDLYTHRPFDEADLSQLGTVSIDHFIPWSFVLHNEIWDLVPSFQKVNSSKSDRLPDLNRYLDQFCDLQYRAFVQAKKIDELKGTMEDYLNVKEDIMLMDDSDNSHTAFTSALKHTIEPLYQIALNQGYDTWQCDQKYEIGG
ncbi:MAG: hypothetical protein LKF79_08410 [Solobacterium sp.]|jgi:hypothetical protein|nr:hypothetical protein [Solobacterium sp.]